MPEAEGGRCAIWTARTARVKGQVGRARERYVMPHATPVTVVWSNGLHTFECDLAICHSRHRIVMRSGGMDTSSVCIRVIFGDSGGNYSDRGRELFTLTLMMSAPVI